MQNKIFFCKFYVKQIVFLIPKNCIHYKNFKNNRTQVMVDVVEVGERGNYYGSNDQRRA